MILTRKAIVASVATLTLAGGLGGLAFANSASAATGTDDTTDSSTVVADSGTSAVTPPAGHPNGPHSANGITETVLTGDTAASVQAAVLAAYPDATIERMETDAEGAVYEAHVKLADGSDSTVKLDANFAITETVQGHG